MVAAKCLFSNAADQEEKMGPAADGPFLVGDLFLALQQKALLQMCFEFYKGYSQTVALL